VLLLSHAIESETILLFSSASLRLCESFSLLGISLSPRRRVAVSP
jgi:hypothetical protein